MMSTKKQTVIEIMDGASHDALMLLYEAKTPTFLTLNDFNRSKVMGVIKSRPVINSQTRKFDFIFEQIDCEMKPIAKLLVSDYYNITGYLNIGKCQYCKD